MCINKIPVITEIEYMAMVCVSMNCKLASTSVYLLSWLSLSLFFAFTRLYFLSHLSASSIPVHTAQNIQYLQQLHLQFHPFYMTPSRSSFIQLYILNSLLLPPSNNSGEEYSMRRYIYMGASPPSTPPYHNIISPHAT